MCKKDAFDAAVDNLLGSAIKGAPGGTLKGAPKGISIKMHKRRRCI